MSNNNFKGIAEFFIELKTHLRSKANLWEQLGFLFYFALPSLESSLKKIQLKKLKKELIYGILELCMLFIPESQYKVSFQIQGLMFSKKMCLLHSKEFLIK
jgi:hypothetical protein